MPQIDPKAFIQKIIRLHKKDSAYLYALFEAHEGWVSYSTLVSPPGVEYCEIELTIPLGFESEMNQLLLELGELIYECKPA